MPIFGVSKYHLHKNFTIPTFSILPSFLSFFSTTIFITFIQIPPFFPLSIQPPGSLRCNNRLMRMRFTGERSDMMMTWNCAMVGSRTWFGAILHRSGLRRHSSDKFPDYHLSSIQEQRLQRLRDRCHVPFDESRPDHQESLTALWYAAFPSVRLTGLVSDQWKDMGWQGPNPSTDFRGCGYISLENMLFFARTYPVSFHRLLFKQDGRRATWEYPFAVAGINVTFMLIQMLDIFSEKPRCVSGKTFVKMLGEDEEAFDVLFCIAFEMMDGQWLATNASYMQFNNVLQATRTQLERELSLEDMQRVQDLPAYNLLYK